MGENARLKVEKYFNENIIFDKIKEEYKELIEKNIHDKK